MERERERKKERKREHDIQNLFIISYRLLIKEMCLERGKGEENDVTR